MLTKINNSETYEISFSIACRKGLTDLAEYIRKQYEMHFFNKTIVSMIERGTLIAAQNGHANTVSRLFQQKQKTGLKVKHCR